MAWESHCALYEEFPFLSRSTESWFLSVYCPLLFRFSIKIRRGLTVMTFIVGLYFSLWDRIYKLFPQLSPYKGGEIYEALTNTSFCFDFIRLFVVLFSGFCFFSSKEQKEERTISPLSPSNKYPLPLTPYPGATASLTFPFSLTTKIAGSASALLIPIIICEKIKWTLLEPCLLSAKIKFLKNLLNSSTKTIPHIKSSLRSGRQRKHFNDY